MTQKFKDSVNCDKKEDLEGYVKYLGIDYEDFYDLNYKKQYEDIDFDDWSR